VGASTPSVTDATFATEAHRAAARELARRHAADLAEICVVVDDETAALRIEGRGTGVGRSEADVEVRQQMRRQFAPWPEAAVVDTGAEGAEGLVCAVAAACGAPGGPSRSALRRSVEQQPSRSST